MVVKLVLEKIKSFFGGYVKGQVNSAIDSLDQYKEDLAKLIDRRMTAENIADRAISFVQQKLRDILSFIL